MEQVIQPFTENATGRADDVMRLLLFMDRFSEAEDLVVGSVDNWNTLMEASGEVLDRLPNEDPEEALELVVNDKGQIIIRLSQDAHDAVDEFLEANGGPVDLDPV